eukprot:3096150-Amphidinium_carterae.1
MAEAKQVAKQTKVIEEAVEKRAAFKEELVTDILKIKGLPPDTVPVPKPSPATYLAFGAAFGVCQRAWRYNCEGIGRCPRPPLEISGILDSTPQPLFWLPDRGKGEERQARIEHFDRAAGSGPSRNATSAREQRRGHGRQWRDSKPRATAWRGARRRCYGRRRSAQAHTRHLGRRGGPPGLQCGERGYLLEMPGHTDSPQGAVLTSFLGTKHTNMPGGTGISAAIYATKRPWACQNSKAEQAWKFRLCLSELLARKYQQS